MEGSSSPGGRARNRPVGKSRRGISIAITEQELDRILDSEDLLPRVRRVLLEPHGALRDQVPDVVVHRGLVFAERPCEVDLCGALELPAHEDPAYLLLLPGEYLAILHPEKWERDLFIRDIMHVHRRNPFEDADQ